MTTAQELAMAFAYSTWHTATAKGRVHKLIACIDARFAELREKEREGKPAFPNPLKCALDVVRPAADEWEPTEEQIESLRKASPIHYSGDDERSVLGQAALRYTIREALIAGHRIAKGECKCSNTSSAVSSPPVSFSSATTSTEAERTAVATKPDAPTESGTPSPKSGASSMDERAEAIFAANPEWRPRSNDQSLSLQFHEGHWTWLSINWFSVDPSPATANAHLLAALLPRAIEKWWSGSRHIESSSSVFGWKLTRSFSSGPPRDLESAINILEGA